MAFSFQSFLSSISAAACIGGVAYYIVTRKDNNILQRSPISLNIFRKKHFTTVEDKKLGLCFAYCPTECVMSAEVRSFPVAFFEMKLLPDANATIVITVEEFSHPISLAEHKIYTYNAIAMHLAQVQIEREKPTAELGGRPAVEFEYTYTPENGIRHRSWCSIAVNENRAYSLHCHSDARIFGQVMLVCRRVLSKMHIYDSSVPDSQLIFTEPRFGLGMEIPPKFSLNYVSDEHSTALLRLTKQTSRHEEPHGIIELEHISSLHPKVIDHHTLDIAITTIRGMIENAIQPGGRLEWQTGTVLDDATLVYLKNSIAVSSFEYDIVSDASKLPGKFLFYDISGKMADNQPFTTRRHVVFVILTVFGVFRMTAWSDMHNFSAIFIDAKEALQKIQFGYQFGQECSLLYKNTKAGFSLRIPPHYHVKETIVGDPIVLFYEEPEREQGNCESTSPKFTIDVTMQMRNVGETPETCFAAYGNYLSKTEKISSIKRHETLVDQHIAAEMEFTESVEDSHVHMVVVLVCVKDRQYCFQLTAQPGCLESAYGEFRKALETLRFIA